MMDEIIKFFVFMFGMIGLYFLIIITSYIIVYFDEKLRKYMKDDKINTQKQSKGETKK